MTGEEETIYRLLTTAHNFAVIGVSDDRQKAGFYTPAYLRGHGFTIYPIHPDRETMLNRKAYASLADVPEPIDIVLIYKRAEAVMSYVDEAIAAGAKAIWLPIGVINEEAAAKAQGAGMDVVMDHCPMVEHKHLNL